MGKPYRIEKCYYLFWANYRFQITRVSRDRYFRPLIHVIFVHGSHKWVGIERSVRVAHPSRLFVKSVYKWS